MIRDDEETIRPAPVPPAGEAASPSELTTLPPGERPVEAGGARSAPGADEAPAWVGPYRILRPLGGGGMGVVYLAEQEQPVRRRVALKLIQPGMESRDLLARFEAERQALALLQHTNIAKVFDAGRSEAGQPYFVMEYVEGPPLTDYCDRERRSLRERLGILIPVCRALHHAHGMGILHRDVKPSNILVGREDGGPVPKVIDFGLAKALGAPLTDRTLYTQLGGLLGTPEYMSPEQAEIDEAGVSPRTDVYSLGVILYELLTGTLPFDSAVLHARGYSEMQRIIREVDPPRPSARVAALGERGAAMAACRATEPARLARALRGELDWITMRAMEKDPARRYPSAAELADDLERHLQHEAVTARPPSLLYRTRKRIRRRPAQVALLATLLLGAPAGAWLGYRVISQQRVIVEAEISEKVRRLLRAGRDADALERLANEILSLDADHLMAWRGRAIAHFNRALALPVQDAAVEEQRRLSLEAVDQLLRLAPERSWPLRLKAFFLDRYGLGAEAQGLRRAAEAIGGEDEDDLFFEAKEILDRDRREAEDLARAERLLSRIILMNERPDAIEARASAREQIRDRDGAIDDYRRLAQIDPSDYFPHLRIAGIRIDQSRFAEAHDHLQRAGELATPAEAWRIAEGRSRASFEEGQGLLANGETDAALRSFERAAEAARLAMEGAPDHPAPRVNLGSSLVGQYRAGGRRDRTLIDAGVEQFDAARRLAKRPGLEAERLQADLALAATCDAYVEAKDLTRALPSCLLATEVLPGNPVAFYNLAGAYMLAGRIDEALAALEKDLALGDRDVAWLRSDPWFERLRGDRRFEDLLRRMEAAARSAASG